MRKPASRTSVAALLAASLTALASPRATLADDEALGRASAAVGRGDYALAEKELASVKTGKDHAEAVLEQARLQLLTGRYDLAIATAKTARAGRGSCSASCSSARAGAPTRARP